jgi:hypothetical protein
MWRNGRRRGLKIPRPKKPCGFKSRHPHHILGRFLKDFAAEAILRQWKFPSHRIAYSRKWAGKASHSRTCAIHIRLPLWSQIPQATEMSPPKRHTSRRKSRDHVFPKPGLRFGIGCNLRVLQEWLVQREITQPTVPSSGHPCVPNPVLDVPSPQRSRVLTADQPNQRTSSQVGATLPQ